MVVFEFIMLRVKHACKHMAASSYLLSYLHCYQHYCENLFIFFNIFAFDPYHEKKESLQLMQTGMTRIRLHSCAV